MKTIADITHFALTAQQKNNFPRCWFYFLLTMHEANCQADPSRQNTFTYGQTVITADDTTSDFLIRIETGSSAPKVIPFSESDAVDIILRLVRII